MKDIFFYDFDFKPLEQFDKYTSLNISKKYCGYGNVEIHFPVTEARVIELLENNRFLLGITKDTHFVVTGWQFGDDLAVFGRTLEWLLGKRVVLPFSLENKTAEQAAVYAVESSMSDFVIVDGLLDVGEKKNYSFDKAQTVLDVVLEVLETEKLGFSLKADRKSKKFVFSVYQGKELPIVLSRSYRNVCDIKYSVDLQKAVNNCGWYQRRVELVGRWDADLNLPKLTSGDNKNNYFKAYEITAYGERFGGLECPKGHYLYCDTMDGIWKVDEKLPETGWAYYDGSTDAGVCKWEGVLDGVKTPEEAEKEFAALGTAEEINVDLRHIEYGTDYNLGDFFRICAEFGSSVHMKKRKVVGVDIYYDENMCGSTPLFQEE